MYAVGYSDVNTGSQCKTYCNVLFNIRTYHQQLEELTMDGGLKLVNIRSVRWKVNIVLVLRIILVMNAM